MIKVKQKSLKETLKKLANFPPSKIVAAGCLKLFTKKEGLVVMQNNMREVSYGRTSADVSKKLLAVCPASVIKDAVDAIRTENVIITSNAHRVYIKSEDEKQKFEVQKRSKEEWPKSEIISKQKNFKTSAEEMSHAIAVCLSILKDSYTSSKSILIECKDKKIYVSSYSGFALSRVKIDPVKSANIKVEIPIESLTNVMKAYKKGELRVMTDDYKVRFDDNRVYVQTIVSGASFPNFEDVKPKHSRKVTCCLDDLKNALKDIKGAYTKDVMNKVYLYSSDKTMKIMSEKNENISICEIECEGDPMEVILDYQTMFEWSKKMKGDYINIWFDYEGNPLIFENDNHELVIQTVVEQ